MVSYDGRIWWVVSYKRVSYRKGMRVCIHEFLLPFEFYYLPFSFRQNNQSIRLKFQMQKMVIFFRWILNCKSIPICFILMIKRRQLWHTSMRYKIASNLSTFTQMFVHFLLIQICIFKKKLLEPCRNYKNALVFSLFLPSDTLIELINSQFVSHFLSKYLLFELFHKAWFKKPHLPLLNRFKNFFVNYTHYILRATLKSNEFLN